MVSDGNGGNSWWIMRGNKSLLLTNLERNPDNVFIYWEGNRYTFEMTADLVVKNTVALQAAGLRPGQRLMCRLSNSLDFVILMMACMELKIVFVPVSPAIQNSVLMQMCRQIQPDMVLIPEEEDFECPPFRVLKTNRLSQSFVCGLDWKEVENRSDIPDIILFTSGSSGHPKPVELTLDNFRASALGWHERLHFSPDDHFLICLPMFHIGGLSILFRALIFGFQVSLLEQFRPDTVTNLLLNKDITLISLVPTMLHRILVEADRLPDSRLRAVILGGGPISESLMIKCREQQLPVVVSYGMTETCSGIAASFIDPSNNILGAEPFSNVQVSIVNGEICAAGPMISAGYFSDRRISQPFHTGDFGKLDENGRLILTAPRDDRIVTGGENIHPMEVEEVMRQHPDVSDCAVVGIPDPEWGQRMVAMVVSTQSDPNLSAFLTKWCRDRLTGEKCPKNYIFSDSIPRSDLGKIQYGQVRAKAAEILSEPENRPPRK